MLASRTHDISRPAEGLPPIAAAVLTYILDYLGDEIRLSKLAEVAGMSESSFCRSFARACGLPPMRWLWNFRLALAAKFIATDPRWSLTDVAFTCGFASSAHFSRSFKATLGISPLAYKKTFLATMPKRPRPGPLLFDQNTDIVVRMALHVVQSGAKVTSHLVATAG